MVRTLDRTAHATRREAFVEVAQQLIQTKGYELMSIQDILDELDASRGAFYHYFDSKESLLEAVVERIVGAAMAAVAPLVADPSLTGLQKLEGFFAGIGRWKGDRKELMVAILRVWASDPNAIVREKFRRGAVGTLAPVLATIVRQGQAEGVFTATSPDHAARVLVALLQSLNDAATELFFAREAEQVSFETVQEAFDAYTEAFERILGLPPLTLTMSDPASLRLWFGR
ncbi:MAG: TetR/AcrR family transcriptional regulator [Candidatus Dormibacteria bacterium]